MDPHFSDLRWDRLLFGFWQSLSLVLNRGSRVGDHDSRVFKVHSCVFLLLNTCLCLQTDKILLSGDAATSFMVLQFYLLISIRLSSDDLFTLISSIQVWRQQRGALWFRSHVSSAGNQCLFEHRVSVGYFYLLSYDFLLNKLCEVISGNFGPDFLCGLLLHLGKLVSGVLYRIVLFLFVPQADLSLLLNEGVTSLAEPLHFLNLSSELGGLVHSS